MAGSRVARTAMPEMTKVQRARVDAAVRATARRSDCGDGQALGDTPCARPPSLGSPRWLTALTRPSPPPISASPAIRCGGARCASCNGCSFSSALAGAAWLVALAVIGYTRSPEPDTPELGWYPTAAGAADRGGRARDRDRPRMPCGDRGSRLGVGPNGPIGGCALQSMRVADELVIASDAGAGRGVRLVPRRGVPGTASLTRSALQGVDDVLGVRERDPVALEFDRRSGIGMDELEDAYVDALMHLDLEVCRAAA